MGRICSSYILLDSCSASGVHSPATSCKPSPLSQSPLVSLKISLVLARSGIPLHSKATDVQEAGIKEDGPIPLDSSGSQVPQDSLTVHMPVPTDSHNQSLHQERKSVALPGPGGFSWSSACTASQAAAEVISVSPGLLEGRERSKPGPAPEGIPTFCSFQFFMPLQPRPQQLLDQLQVTIRSSEPKPLSCPSPLQGCVGCLDCMQHRQVFSALHPTPTPTAAALSVWGGMQTHL